MMAMEKLQSRTLLYSNNGVTMNMVLRFPFCSLLCVFVSCAPTFPVKVHCQVSPSVLQQQFWHSSFLAKANALRQFIEDNPCRSRLVIVVNRLAQQHTELSDNSIELGIVDARQYKVPRLIIVQ